MIFRTDFLFCLFWQFAILFVVTLLSLQSSLLLAQTTVTNGNDSGPGSLREILNTAGDGDTIDFAPAVTVIYLTSGQIVLNKDFLTIQGNNPGTPDALKDTLSVVIADTKINDTTDLQDELLALPYASPTITGTVDITGATSNIPYGSLLSWAPATWWDNSYQLSQLTFKDSVLSARTADDINPTGTAEINLMLGGGTVYLRGNITLNQVAFLNNNLSATVGEARAGNVSTNAYAYASGYAAGGGGIFEEIVEIDHSVFFSNSLNATGGIATGGTVSSSTMTGPQTFAYATASASGGGGEISGTVSINDSVFSCNILTATGGIATGGTATATIASGASASAYANANATGGGVYISGDDTLVNNSVFFGNVLTATGGTATGGTALASSSGSYVSAHATADGSAAIYGGGGFFSGENTQVNNSVLSGNTLTATVGTVTGGTATTNNGYYPFASTYIFATAKVFGGGANFEGENASLKNSILSGNTLMAIGGKATGGTANVSLGGENFVYASVSAIGGGAYFWEGNTMIENSVLSDNTLTAIGAEYALGGTGTKEWANADAYAFGGGAYVRGESNTLINVVFQGNSLEASATGNVVQNEPGAYNGTGKAYALGGAVFVSNSDYSFTPSSTLNLIADGGNVLISGNTANGTPSGIHFGRGEFYTMNGYFGDSAETSTLNVKTVNATDKILMYDPLTVEAYRGTLDVGTAAFAMNVDGPGEFVWGGKNILDANGGSTVTLSDGSNTFLAKDFTLTTTANIDYRTGDINGHDSYAMASVTDPTGNTNPLAVVLQSDSTLKFDLARDENLAMFDFTNVTGGEIFTVENHVNLGVKDTSRQIFDFEKTYLVADGVTQTEADVGMNHFQSITSDIQGFEVRDHLVNGVTMQQLWVNVAYSNPKAALFRENINSLRALKPLSDIILDESLVSDDEYDAILQNARSVTAEYYSSRGIATLRSIRSLADLNVYRHFECPKNWDTHWQSTWYRYMLGNNPYRSATPRRLWGGYYGEFGNVKAHARREEFNTALHGLFAGADWMFDRNTIFGVYGGYMNETLAFEGINSRVNSNGLQLGVFAHRHLGGGNILNADLGYIHFENDGRRLLGNYAANGSFDQNAATLGLGWEQRIRTGLLLEWNPFVRLRYAYLTQDTMHETGNSATTSSLDGLNGNSFVSRFGTSLAARYRDWESQLHLAWAHEYGDTCVTSSSRYHLGGNHFDVSSAVLDRDHLEMGVRLGRSWKIRASQLGINLDYDLAASKHTTQHTVSATTRIRF